LGYGSRGMVSLGGGIEALSLIYTPPGLCYKRPERNPSAEGNRFP
jgi:hypothetical protein